MRFSFGAIATCAVALLVASPQPGAQSRVENVILVTLDGARWQEIFTGLDESLLQSASPKGVDIRTLPVHRDFSAPTPEARRERLMPFLWRTFVTQHGFIAGHRTAGSSVDVTNRHWFSYPGYSEILTGQAHDAEIKSNDPIQNPFPTVLQFAKRKLQLQTPQVATFASWSVFKGIVESKAGETTVNAGVQPYRTGEPSIDALSNLQMQTPAPWDGIRHDSFTFRFALDHLKRHHPRLLYIAFDETDDWAHDGKYDRVLRMLNTTDAWLGELWSALQADSQYRGKTMMIVTTDHGRGRTMGDWRSHGKDVPGADEIWLAMASPAVNRRGVWKSVQPLYQNQIAATIAAALGLDYREQNPNAGRPIPLATP